MAEGPPEKSRGAGERPDPSDVDDLVAEYLDRLNSGASIDPFVILSEHPELGPEVIEKLETFVDLTPQLPDERRLGVLGDYTLRRQIGRGGMGVVYEAWQGSMDRRVALKVMPKAVAADTKAVARFIQEAQLAGKLSHPNIVHVHGMGVEEQVPYYAMELVEGETLAEIAARLKDAPDDAATPFGPRSAQQFYFHLAQAFADVADGLQHAHAHKVIHRDIKPSNLILEGEADGGGRRTGRLRILDFGLARLEGQESITVSGDFVGTPQYMSPEQARRKKIAVDHRTDVYSLGATLYEMLTLQPPFRGKDHQDTLSQIVERDPVEPRKLNQRVPKDLETIVLKCLRKDASDRYGTAEALGQDLSRFVRGDPIEARPQGAWELFARRFSRNGRKLLVAAGIVTFLLVCGALSWRLRLERQTARLYVVQDYDRRVVSAAMKLLRGEWILATRSTAASKREYLLPRCYQDLLLESGKLGADEAFAELTRAIADLPDRFEGYYYRARGRKLLGDEAGAIDDLRKCVGRKPSFLPARALLSEVQGAGGKSEEPFYPPSPDGRDRWAGAWVRAHQAMKREAWKEAAAAFGELLDFEEGLNGELFLGSSIENLLGRGVALMETGDSESAKLNFRDAQILSRRLWGEFLEPLLLLGKVYFLQGDAPRTESLFLDALSRSADKKKTALWMAAVYQSLVPDLEQSGRHGDAVAAARKAVQLQADDDAARLRLGWTLLRNHWPRKENGAKGVPAGLDTLQEIEALVAEALAHDPNDSTAYFLWSKALEAQGKLELASELSGKAEVLREGAGSSRGPDSFRKQDMNTRDFASRTAMAAALSLGLGVEGRGQHAREGSFTDVQRLGEPLNSPFLDYVGGASGDGRTLVAFTSDRPGGSGGTDIYIAERQNPTEPWSVTNVAELNSPSDEFVSFLSDDGLQICYTLPGGDVYLATRATNADPFENVTPICEVNSENAEIGLSMTVDGLEAFFVSDRPGGVGDRDIWAAARSSVEDECFTEFRNLEEINTPNIDGFPSISADGLTLFWSDFPTASARPGGKGGADIWCASRAEPGLDKEFGPAVNLGSPINTGGRDFWIRVSPRWPEDGALVYFTRCLDANCVDMDIYQATWRLSPTFRRGDANADGRLDLSDGVSILNSLFLGAPAPSCADAADANDDGRIDLSDAVFDFGYLFLGAIAPSAPGPDACGTDPTEDRLPGCVYGAPGC